MSKFLATNNNKAGSNAVRLTGWKTVSRHKRRAKIDTDPHQQFKIPMVVNRFAIWTT
jgi:hypothetical protein